VLPSDGPVLLSWTGLLGLRELMATGQHCRETALPRSSSSAKPSRAEGTACRLPRGGEQGREMIKEVCSGRVLRDIGERNLHSP